jgi:hypothetical protein
MNYFEANPTNLFISRCKTVTLNINNKIQSCILKKLIKYGFFFQKRKILRNLATEIKEKI